MVSERTYFNSGGGGRKNFVSLAGRTNSSRDPVRNKDEKTRRELLSKMSGAVTDVPFGKGIASIFGKSTVLLKNKTHDQI